MVSAIEVKLSFRVPFIRVSREEMKLSSDCGDGRLDRSGTKYLNEVDH